MRRSYIAGTDYWLLHWICCNGAGKSFSIMIANEYTEIQITLTLKMLFNGSNNEWFSVGPFPQTLLENYKALYRYLQAHAMMTKTIIIHYFL